MTKKERVTNDYISMTFESREKSGRPGTPHRFFDHSWSVHMNTQRTREDYSVENPPIATSLIEIAEEEGDNELVAVSSFEPQIVHCHANGLCVITAGDVVRTILESKVNMNVTIVKVSFLVHPAAEQSVGAKRKKKAKLDKNIRCSGIIRPIDDLVEIVLSDFSKVTLKACVFGSLLEVNSHLSTDVSLLQRDPLLNGYLAVIMPSGIFPPPRLNDKT